MYSLQWSLHFQPLYDNNWRKLSTAQSGHLWCSFQATVSARLVHLSYHLSSAGLFLWSWFVPCHYRYEAKHLLLCSLSNEGYDKEDLISLLWNQWIHLFGSVCFVKCIFITFNHKMSLVNRSWLSTKVKMCLWGNDIKNRERKCCPLMWKNKAK